MPEIHAYRSLKTTVKRGVWFRFENPLTPGLPDALVIIRDVNDPEAVKYTWLEAKELKRRVREKVWLIDNLRDEQLQEITRLNRIGASVYLLLHKVRRRWLIPATFSNLLTLQTGVSDEWLSQNDVPWQKALLPEPLGSFY